MLKLININKTYDNKVKALKNINLELDKNELAVIIGPSGCGKTTLLRTIAGLEKQDTGDILIQDKLVNDLAPYMRDISFVFQDASLFAHMNVFDNIAYGNHGNMDKKQLRQKVEKISKILKIEDLLTRYPSKLSGGQRQRVAIARAICKSSKLILMDEPFSNLDAQLKEDLIQEIKMLQKELDLMIIYVTHDQKEAFALADKLIVMEDGHILQIDKPSNVYRHPINPFVARFFGDINIFEGNIEDDYLEFANYKIKLNKHFSNGKILFGIRPEDIIIGSTIELQDVQKEDRGNYYLYMAKIKDFSISIKTNNDILFNKIDFPKEKIIVWKKVLDEENQ